MRGNTIKKTGFRSFFPGMLSFVVLAHFSHHLVTSLPIPLLPFIRDEFKLDYTQSGLVISAFTLAYGISQLPAGWLADRIGPRILVTISICGVALAGILIGLSQTYIMMIVFLVLMGVLGGGYHPSSPPLVSALVEPSRRGWALGLHMLGGSASHFVAPLIAAAITVAWGWRSPFIILAVPAMVFGIFYYVFLGRLADMKRAGPEIISGHDQKPTPPYRSRRLASILILSIFTGSVIFSTSSFIPLLVVDEFGFSKEAAAAIIAVFYFTGLWASPLGGYLSDRLGGVPVLLIASFAAGPFIYLLNLAPNGWGIGAVLVIIGITMYIRMPAAESYIVSKASEHHRSSILGIYYFGNLEGVGVMTPVIGYLIDRFGFYLSFTIIGAALVAVTLVCSIWLRGSRD